jgi:hypothetical protein
MLDVKVARADAAHRDAHNGILGRLQRRFLFLYQAKFAMVDISQCFHNRAIIGLVYIHPQSFVIHHQFTHAAIDGDTLAIDE